MIKGLSLVGWDQLAAELANSDDTAQVQFFKAFCKECLSWGTALQVEKQLASVNLGLTKEERKTLSMISFEGEL